MTIQRVIAVLLVTVCWSSANAVAQIDRKAKPLPDNRMLDQFGLERAWWSQATIDPTRSTVRYLSVDEDALYVQTTGGIVTAFDAETGRKRWAHQLGMRDRSSYPVTTNDDLVLVTAGLKIYAVEKLKGKVLWTISLPNQPSTSPTLGENYVYIGTLDGSLYSFDIRTIQRLYGENLLPQYSERTQKWRFKTGQHITTPAVEVSPTVNFASSDGSLYSVDIETRELRWQFETDKPVSAPLGLTQGRIYLASQDLNVYCIKATSGAVYWEFIVGYAILEPPAVIDNEVYFIGERGGLFCLTADRGYELWRQKGLVKFLGATKKYVFASDRIGEIVVLSRETGELLGAMPLLNFSARFVNDRNDRLYLSTQDGLVVCLREKGKEFPTFHKFPDHMPIMPEIASEEVAESPAPSSESSEAAETEPAPAPGDAVP